MFNNSKKAKAALHPLHHSEQGTRFFPAVTSGQSHGAGIAVKGTVNSVYVACSRNRSAVCTDGNSVSKLMPEGMAWESGIQPQRSRVRRYGVVAQPCLSTCKQPAWGNRTGADSPKNGPAAWKKRMLVMPQIACTASISRRHHHHG